MADDDTADSQVRAIINSFQEGANFLVDWRNQTTLMFHDRPELLDLISHPSKLDVTHVVGGVTEHDTCNTPQKVGANFESIILQWQQIMECLTVNSSCTKGIVTTTCKTYGWMQLKTFWLRSGKKFSSMT
jgi:hypothetical protein